MNEIARQYSTKGARGATNDGPCKIALTVSRGQAVTLSAPLTNDWNGFRTVSNGPLIVAAAGIQTVTARPADPDTWNSVNLRRVVGVLIKPERMGPSQFLSCRMVHREIFFIGIDISQKLCQYDNDTILEGGASVEQRHS